MEGLNLFMSVLDMRRVYDAELRKRLVAAAPVAGATRRPSVRVAYITARGPWDAPLRGGDDPRRRPPQVRREG